MEIFGFGIVRLERMFVGKGDGLCIGRLRGVGLGCVVDEDDILWWCKEDDGEDEDLGRGGDGIDCGLDLIKIIDGGLDVDIIIVDVGVVFVYLKFLRVDVLVFIVDIVVVFWLSVKLVDDLICVVLYDVKCGIIYFCFLVMFFIIVWKEILFFVLIIFGKDINLYINFCFIIFLMMFLL